MSLSFMTSNYQTQISSLKDRMKHLLTTGKLSDCRFRVGSGEERRTFLVHKILLSTASPVFERMFFGSLPEESNKDVEVDDIEPNDFYNLLYFIYTDDLNVNSTESARNLYCAAHKYIIEALKNRCIDYIRQNIKPDSVCIDFDFAHQYEITDLMTSCVEKIKTEASNVLKSTTFCEMQLSSLNIIMDQPKLNIETELELFQALERYADARIFSRQTGDEIKENVSISLEKKGGEQGTTLIQNEITTNQSMDNTLIKNLEDVDQTDFIKSFEEIVKKIRFLTMAPREFAIGPAISRILRPKDALSLFACVEEKSNIKNYFPKGFNISMESRRSSPQICFSGFSLVTTNQPNLNTTFYMSSGK